MKESFVMLSGKVKAANRARSKEVKLTLEEAAILVSELNEVLIEQNKLLSQLVELSKKSMVSDDIEIKSSTF